MEDFDDPPTSRLQKNLPAVVIATLLAAIGWYFPSKQLAPADCTRLQQLLRLIADQGTTPWRRTVQASCPHIQISRAHQINSRGGYNNWLIATTQKIRPRGLQSVHSPGRAH